MALERALRGPSATPLRMIRLVLNERHTNSKPELLRTVLSEYK